MKFSAENAAFNKIWDSVEGPTIINMILNDPDLLQVKPHYFRTAFSMGGYIPTDDTGAASFTVKAKLPTHADVMDMRAPLGEGKPAEEGESLEYSGSIKGFIAPTYDETAAERMYRDRIIEKYGSDAAILAGFATNELAPRIEAGYYTLDYMAIRAETTLKCRYDIGRGIKSNIYRIPEEYSQKVNAGAKVWSDPTADILTSIMNIQEKKWLEWGVEIPMQLKVTEDFFRDVIMKNQGIIDMIKTNWLTAQGQLVAGTDKVSNWVITESNFNTYVASQIPNFPKITITKPKMIIDRKLVNPWEDGIAVLCPNTMAGEVLRTDSLDEQVYSQYGNKACSFAFSRTADGLMLVCSSVLPNGSLTERHMKVVMDAVPVLTDFQYRSLINTKSAD